MLLTCVFIFKDILDRASNLHLQHVRGCIQADVEALSSVRGAVHGGRGQHCIQQRLRVAVEGNRRVRREKSKN